MYRIEFVETDNNKKPFKEFINALTLEEQADVFVAINKLCYLKNNALRISEKLSKSIRDGIYELRVHHFNKISRSFYFYYIDKRIVFTHGFIKKTDKIPSNEIEKAIKLMNEFKSKKEKL